MKRKILAMVALGVMTLSQSTPLSAQFGGTAARAPADRQTGFLDRTIVVEGITYPYQVFVPRDYRPGLPIILFLHGAGRRGDDGITPTQEGMGPAIRDYPERYPAIVVFPQAPAGGSWQAEAATMALATLDASIAEFAPDLSRTYLVGHSLGGNGAWYLAYHSSERFAAVVPVCTWVEALATFPRIAPPEAEDPFIAVARGIGNTPIFMVHGDADALVPVDQSRKMAAALGLVGANYTYIEMVGVGHNTWDPTYYSSVFTSWLFSQKKP